MKLILAAIAAAVTISCLVPAEASAKSRNTRKSQIEYRGVYDRTNSVQPNGLCQRDTGTPTSQLNFRNKCETEEYWARVLDGSRRR